MKDYEQRVSFLSKMTGTPRNEVDKVIAYINSILAKNGLDAPLDAYDISCYTQVKIERVQALMGMVAEMNVNMAKYEPYLNKSKLR